MPCQRPSCSAYSGACHYLAPPCGIEHSELMSLDDKSESFITMKQLEKILDWFDSQQVTNQRRQQLNRVLVHRSHPFLKAQHNRTLLPEEQAVLDRIVKELFLRNAPLINHIARICTWIIWDKAVDYQDVEQEIFLNLPRVMERYDPFRGSTFTAFLQRLMSHWTRRYRHHLYPIEFSEFVNQNVRHNLEIEDTHALEPYEEVEKTAKDSMIEHLYDALLTMVKDLPEMHRVTMILRHRLLEPNNQKRTYDELSKVLFITRSRVGQLVQESHVMLKGLFEEERLRKTDYILGLKKSANIPVMNVKRWTEFFQQFPASEKSFLPILTLPLYTVYFRRALWREYTGIDICDDYSKHHLIFLPLTTEIVEDMYRACKTDTTDDFIEGFKNHPIPQVSLRGPGNAVLSLLYGLQDKTCRTRQDVCKFLGISNGMFKEIYNRSIRNLRHQVEYPRDPVYCFVGYHTDAYINRLFVHEYGFRPNFTDRTTKKRLSAAEIYMRRALWLEHAGLDILSDPSLYYLIEATPHQSLFEKIDAARNQGLLATYILMLHPRLNELSSPMLIKLSDQSM
ncbi:MAG: hypothetical protein GF384_00375 [Elusimicrobia bacterium]|nr:hypothetical protein [Elusimicrobiota bacterium]MBD3411550.1 hypothetical protein [Elusimicrobiota bacterium]